VNRKALIIITFQHLNDSPYVGKENYIHTCGETMETALYCHISSNIYQNN